MSADSLRQRMQAQDRGGGAAAPLTVYRTKKFRLTAGELLEACKSCPDQRHPLIAVFTRAVQNMRPQDDVVVDRIDMEALLDNKEVELVEELQPASDAAVAGGGSVRVRTKKLVPRKSSVSSAAAAEKGSKKGTSAEAKK